MYLGKIVEMGPLDKVFENPVHPYTATLLAAVPVPDPRYRRTEPIPKGEIPSPINPPPGFNREHNHDHHRKKRSFNPQGANAIKEADMTIPF
ncbi:MAG: hypothetical protein DRG82_04805 [Deltaproteobacteria bacterium]|nr:MAG: hypothetical protein DRG82_04805 [Deltaproteobacteria bacterium]